MARRFCAFSHDRRPQAYSLRKPRMHHLSYQAPQT